jgi:uncharacterized protein YjbI with pentapeptide repeats
MQVKHIDWYIFDDCDLREMDLSERILNGASFIKADARGALFIKSQLKDANFEGANLRNAYFVDADLQDANFEGADLRGAVFTRADLRGALLKRSITDARTTWDDASMGSSVRQVERTTDGLQQIDVLEFVMFESEEA